MMVLLNCVDYLSLALILSSNRFEGKFQTCKNDLNLLSVRFQSKSFSFSKIIVASYANLWKGVREI